MPDGDGTAIDPILRSVDARVSSMKEYVDRLFVESDKAHDAALKGVVGQIMGLKDLLEQSIATRKHDIDQLAANVQISLQNVKEANALATSNYQAVSDTVHAQQGIEINSLKENTVDTRYFKIITDQLRDSIQNLLTLYQRDFAAMEKIVADKDGTLDDRILAAKKQEDERFEARRTYVDKMFDEINLSFSSRMTVLENGIKAVDSMSSERSKVVRDALEAAMAASDKAVVKAEVSSEKRFETLNDFKTQVSDQLATYMPREVTEALISELRRTYEQQLAEIRNQLVQLQQRQDQAAGSSAGVSKSVGYMISALGIVLTIIIFLVNFISAK